MNNILDHMKAPLAVLLALVAAGCAKSEAEKREEVVGCSAVNTVAAAIALCLETEHRWDRAEALTAGQAREHELDSLRAWRDDSLWQADARRHREEVRRCNTGDLARCLQVTYGWPERRALAAADSVWRAEAPKHRREIQACARRRESSVGSCLMLYYKWSPERALGVDDSIRRASLK